MDRRIERRDKEKYGTNGRVGREKIDEWRGWGRMEERREGTGKVKGHAARKTDVRRSCSR